MKKNLVVLLLALYSSTVALAQDGKDLGLKSITSSAANAQLNFLASDVMEGRDAVSRGGLIAAEYIASMFEYIGLEPYGDIPNGDKASFFQAVPICKLSNGNKQSFKIHSGAVTYDYNYSDYLYRSGSINSKLFTAPMVFVGYGIVDGQLSYDDTKNVDVKGKVVIRIAGFPGHRDPNSDTYKKFAPKDEPSFNYGNKKRTEEADKRYMKNGALAVVTITRGGLRVDAKPSFYPSEVIHAPYERYDLEDVSEDIISIYVSDRVGKNILEGSGVDIDAFETNIMKSQKPYSASVNGKSAEVCYDIKKEKFKTINVLGMLKGEDTTMTLVIGAHYDHMGINKDNFIFNGADDNASGTAAVMTIARAFVASGVKPKCNVLFAAWTAEERGLLGSQYFVNKMGEDINSIKMNINLDMISRNFDDDPNQNKVEMPYTETYPLLEQYTKDNVAKYNLNLDVMIKADTVGTTEGTDFSPFSVARRPYISFHTGLHEDYHLITDEIKKLNYDKFLSVIKLAYLNAWDMANKPIQYVK